VTVEAITVDSTFFRPIRVTEEVMEGLIRTAAAALFPGYDYFVFRPAIRCGATTRHPDGALLSRVDPTWWVVEVESHLHSVDEHIEPQLHELATGFYGPDAFAYLKRHRAFDASTYNINLYEPSFLLVIDSLTSQIRDAAIRNGFETLECGPFRSERNEYALAVSGFRPRRDLAPTGPGLTLTLTEESGMAVLCPVDGGRVPALPTDDVIVADVVYKSFVRSDGGGIVLPLTAGELRALLAGAANFRLVSSGQLFALPDVMTTVLVKE
jgi:hypothetical protein